MRDATISLGITPSLLIKGWLHCYLSMGGWRPSVRQRDAPDASSRLTSFSVEGWESRVLLRSSWRVYRWCGLSVFVVDALTLDSWVPLIWLRNKNKSSSGGGVMCGIKVPQQDFALKMPGKLMREGRCICGTLRYIHVHKILKLNYVSGYARKRTHSC